ncbi:MAG: ArnT family glycosyltransferase [Acidobacteriota bacterium]|jgi:hypothetical protein
MSSNARTPTQSRNLPMFVAISLFAFWAVWHYGHRGLMILDHSIVFDGGYRVYLGQTLYKDFYAAYFPGVLWLQALAFHLFGVNFTAMVLPAAFFNAVGAAISMRLVWRLFPGSRIPAAAAGLLTAFWFQTPYGAVMHEQAAFFFALLSVWLLIEFETWPARYLAGLACIGAILCKQNAGLLFAIPATAILAAQILPNWRQLPRQLLPLAAGLATGVGAFLLWVRFVSDWDGFILHAFTIPMSLAGNRLPRDPLQIIRLLSTMDSPLELMRYAAAIILIASLLGFASSFSGERNLRLRVASVLAVTMVLYQNTFRHTALNDPENALPFIGLSFGLALAILAHLFWNRLALMNTETGSPILKPGAINRLASMVFAFFALLLLEKGLAVARGRAVHEFRPGAVFEQQLAIPTAANVVWGHPTPASYGENPPVVEREQFEQLYQFLAGQPHNFFLYNDATILYGLTGRIPPQPLLFFLEGHTFRQQDIPALDQAILSALKKNEVRVFVRETAVFMPQTASVELFPETYRWLTTDFRRVKTIGIYEIWQR